MNSPTSHGMLELAFYSLVHMARACIKQQELSNLLLIESCLCTSQPICRYHASIYSYLAFLETSLSMAFHELPLAFYSASSLRTRRCASKGE